MGLSSEETLLIASVAPATNAEAVASRAALIDLPREAAVEIRLDALTEPPALDVLRGAFEGRTLVATLRSAEEGGAFRGSAGEVRDLLTAALAAGFDYADLELRREGESEIPGIAPSKTILSLHDLEGLPADLNALVARMLATPARFVKLVATANDSVDARRLLELQAAHPGGRLATFGMGEAGIATRVLSPYLGAALSYGALLPDRATAPGQLLARDLADVYGIGGRRRVSRLFALLGGSVSHSLSPALHNATFVTLGREDLYVPFAMRMLGRELEPLVAALDALGLPLAGASVTIPFKEEAALLAENSLDERAVNTLLRSRAPGQPPGFRGVNTDRAAFEAVIEDASKETVTGRAGAVALVLGAGGTARVAVDVLRKRGWEVFISNRSEGRGAALAQETGSHALSMKSGAAWPEPRVIVNATAVGLLSVDPLPCEQSLLRPGTLVIDAPYRAGGTALVKAARAAGARVVDGQTLLLLQAAAQAALFTGAATTPRDLLGRVAPRFQTLFSGYEEVFP